MGSIPRSRMPFATRMTRLGSESAFEVLSRAREMEKCGKNIIHLEIGEPDFPTVGHVVDAAVRALKDGWTHYCPAAGLPELREMVAEDVARRRGIAVDPTEVVITPGAKPIIFFTIMALVDEGDEVLYPNPGFPIYESMINFVGGQAVPYPLPEADGFDLDACQILDKITGRTRLIIMNSPHNPTGGVVSRTQLDILASVLVARDIFVLSDEIYSRFVFEGKHASITQCPGMKVKTIIVDGFSKTFAMTGWRLGYGVMHAELAQQVALLMTNSNSCTASFIQIAGVEALKGDQSCVDQMLEEFRLRRDLVVTGLRRIAGFRCAQPQGAFYVFPNITETQWNSRDIAEALLTEAGVACLPGTAFGVWGEGYLRFSYANSIGNIQTALTRVETWARQNL